MVINWSPERLFDVDSNRLYNTSHLLSGINGTLVVQWSKTVGVYAFLIMAFIPVVSGPLSASYTLEHC